MSEYAWIDAGDGRKVFRRVRADRVARSSLPFPMVISDEMEPTEQVDGHFYTSKTKFRSVGRALGLTEVGNEKLPPRKRPQPDRKAIEAAVGKAIARLKA